MNKENFEIIESLFIKIIEFLGRSGLIGAQADVAHYVDVGEYGIAFESALDASAEWGQPLPREVLGALESIAEKMNLNDPILDALKKLH